jgi:hypothetical protein
VPSVIDRDPDSSFSGDARIVTVKRRIQKEGAEDVRRIIVMSQNGRKGSIYEDARG